MLQELIFVITDNLMYPFRHFVVPGALALTCAFTALQCRESGLLVGPGSGGFWQDCGEIRGGIGGPFYALDAELLSDSTWLIATASGIQRSIDQGATWRPPSGASGGTWTALARFPDGEIVAGGEGCFAQSTDNGATWSSFGHAPPGYFLRCGNLVISPAGTLFASVEGSQTDFTLRTSDRGETWSRIADTLGEMTSMIVTSRGDLMGYPNGRRSTDDGLTWQSIGATSLPQFYVVRAFGPFAYGLTYNRRAYRSTDDGSTWTPMRTGTRDSIATAVGVDEAGTVYLGFLGAVYRSLDGGVSWTPGVIDIKSQDVSVFASNASATLACTGAGVFRSTDHGANWTRCGDDARDHTPGPFLVASESRIINVTKAGIFSSDDHGVSWNPVLAPLETPSVYVAAKSPVSGHLYIRTDSSLFRSEDGGTSWVNVGLRGAAFWWILAVTPSGRIFTERQRAEIVVSADEGRTWTRSTLPIDETSGDVSSIALWKNEIRADGNVSPGSVCYRSFDDGLTWSVAPLDTMPLPFAEDRRGTLYRLGTTSLFRSTDNGVSWTDVKRYMEGQAPPLAPLAVRLGATGTLYMLTYDGLWRSFNRGNTWENIGASIIGDRPIAMEFDASGYLYVATTRGIRRSVTPCFWQ